MMSDLDEDHRRRRDAARVSHCSRTSAASIDMPTLHEEQAEQHAAERLDIGFELMPEVRLGQEQPGQERAHRHREPDLLHQQRRAEHHEQRARRSSPPGRRCRPGRGRNGFSP